MTKTLRGKLTYANVISTLCLFLVMGGGAYAATQIPKNSIGAKQIKKESIPLSKLTPGAQAALKGATGPQGPKGADAATNLTIVQATATGTASAECPAGSHPTGGGAIDNAAGGLKASYPNVGLDGKTPSGGWTGIATTGTDSVTVREVCATP